MNFQIKFNEFIFKLIHSTKNRESSYTNLRSIIPTSDTYQFHSKSKYLLPTSHYLSQTSSNFPSPSKVPQSLAFSPISDSSLESPQKPIQYDIEDQELKQRISSLKESIKQIGKIQSNLSNRSTTGAVVG